jgi:hypothetical protein
MAAREDLLELNHAVALTRLERYVDAASILRRIDRADLAEAMLRAHEERQTWLGFWFGRGTTTARRVVGVLLLVAVLISLLPVVIDAREAPWLGWAAQGNVRPLVPLVVFALLFVLPIVNRINVAGIEIEQPAAAAPSEVELTAVSWDAVTRKVASVARSTSVVAAGELRTTELEVNATLAATSAATDHPGP